MKGRVRAGWAKGFPPLPGEGQGGVAGLSTATVKAFDKHRTCRAISSQMHTLTTLRARDLRRFMTQGERRLWWQLQRRQMAGRKFRRQFPMGPYFADFACPSAKLVVEIDGPSHDDRLGHDAKRDAYLAARGYRVLRFTTTQLDEDFPSVVETIWQVLTSGPSSTSTPP